MCASSTRAQRETCEMQELPRAVAVAITAFRCRMRNLGHVLMCSLKLAFLKGKWEGLSIGSQHLTELEYSAAAE